MDSKRAYLILNLLPGIGPLRVNQLLTLFATPEAILEASPARLAAVPGVGGKLAAVVSGWRDLCDPDLEERRVRDAGVVFVTRDDAEYPALLREIHDPPLGLYVRGDLAALSRACGGIAVVGSRHTTTYGMKMAERLSTAAALAGWPVVSGLARGIDTIAHEAVLKVRGCTVAVIGSGLGCVYPQENIDLARRIAACGGAVISEFPMLYRPEKRTFPMRNRIISGMTRGTLVIEAGTKSGSLITANQAAEQNRQVFAVPGRVDSPQSRGCHALIKDGAKLVEDFGDVLEEFRALPGFPGVSTRAERGSSPGRNGPENRAADLQLTPAERKILSFLGENETTVDDVVSQLDESPPDVLRALFTLELKRLVRQLPGKRVAKVSGIPG